MKLWAPVGAGIAIVMVLIVVFTSGIMEPPDTDTEVTPNTTQITSNSPPIANNQSVTTAMNTPLDIALTANDVDVNDNLTGAIVTPSSHGTLSPINQDTGIVTYTPNTGFTGDDSFTFIANDGKQNSTKVGIVEIRVNNN